MRLKEIQPQKPLKKRFLKGRKKLGKMLENVGKKLEGCWNVKNKHVVHSTEVDRGMLKATE